MLDFCAYQKFYCFGADVLTYAQFRDESLLWLMQCLTDYRECQFPVGHSHHVGARLEEEQKQCSDTIDVAENLWRAR